MRPLRGRVSLSPLCFSLRPSPLVKPVRRQLHRPATWLAQDGTVTLPNFRFGTGETLPELKLHYLTLGTPHRNAAGHVDNADPAAARHRRQCALAAESGVL